jgi:hypothetical protein
MIKIDFEFDAEPYGVFRDALHLPDNHGLSDADIEALKQERFDAWMAIVNPPPSDVSTPAPEPTPPPAQVTVNGETYTILTGVPSSGAKVIEIDGTWYQSEAA